MNQFDDLLRRHRATPNRPLRSNFTNYVIETIAAEPRMRGSRSAVQEFYMRLLQLPKFALVTLAVAGAASVSTGAYAAYQWLVPQISITHITSDNDDHKREFAVSVKDCGVMVGGAIVNNGTQRYELAQDANLTTDQVIHVLKDSCNYQQIQQMANTRWHDPTPSTTAKPDTILRIVASGAGADNILNDPPIGTVTALDASHITISTKVYQEYDGPNFFAPDAPIPDFNTLNKYYPAGKTLGRTFALSPSAELVENGQTTPTNQLKVGDTVYFMSQSQRTVQADLSWSAPTNTEVIRLIKTDINPDYVKAIGLGNPAITGAIARLEGCQGNGQYLCIAAKSSDLQYKIAYAVPQFQDLAPNNPFTSNDKYFRGDITQQTMQPNMFHQVEGRITSLDGTKMTVQSRGKVVNFSVSLPYDAVTAFNKNAKNKMAVGGLVQVNYMQKTGEDHTAIQSSDILGLSLVLRQLPDGSLAPY